MIRTQLKTRFPWAYWKLRNWYALLQWYWDRYTSSKERAEDAYDEGFWQFHDTGDWAGLADLILRYYQPGSVVDVGCGDGKLLSAFHQQQPDMPLRGYDFSPTAIRRAAQRNLDVRELDVIALSARQAESLSKELQAFDVCVCLEVAEHIPAWHAAKLLTILTSADTLVFSAAQPLQGGVLHVNEQPIAYWKQRFQRLGFRHAETNADFVAELQKLDLPWWYHRNVQVFRRDRVLA